MERKNILFISSWFPNKLEPTNGNFVQRHAEAVSLLNDVEILHAIGDSNQKETFFFDDQNINGIRTLIVYYKKTGNPIQNFLRRINAYKKGFSRLKKPDLVHANVLFNSMLFAVYLKRKFKIPFVVTEHWTALRKVNSEKTPKSIKIIAKFIGNKADRILPVSNDLMMGLQNISIKTPMTVVPNVVNTHLFSPKTHENNDFTFIHVSNLIPRKNAEKIVSAAISLLKRGHNFKLQIGGDGSEKVISGLNRMVAVSDFKDKIEVFGIQTIEQVAARMKESNCFILFSDDENQPCVIGESFASGLNVISTNVGGIGEFFPEEAGVLLADTNLENLENAMLEMLQTKINSEKKLVDYASKTFSVEAISRQFDDIYRQILKA